MVKRENDIKRYQRITNPRTKEGVQYSGKITAKSSEEAKKIYRKNFGVRIVDFKTFRRATPTKKGVYGIWFKD